MGSSIQCFMIESTDRARCSLRRYVSSDKAKCSGPFGYHNAHTPIGDRVLDPAALPRVFSLADKSQPLHNDSQWPSKCEHCDYIFAADDEWQLFYDVLYARVDNGAEMTLRTAPPGAMWDADWLPEKGPDGRSLVVKLPPGGMIDEWHVDGPSNNGPGWTRSGEAPRITANPSILTPHYHGWLRDGVLVEC
jgi:hypothetical protein